MTGVQTCALPIWLHWNGRVPGRDEKTHEAMLFVLNLMGVGFISHNIPKICLENPVGRISSAFRKPDQIIQPWQFGEDASKKTCLWLKGLPLLKPTNVLPGGPEVRRSGGPEVQSDSVRPKQAWAVTGSLERAQQDLPRYSGRYGRTVGIDAPFGL